MPKRQSVAVFTGKMGKCAGEKTLEILNYDGVEAGALKNNIRLKKLFLGERVQMIGRQSFFCCTAMNTAGLGQVKRIGSEAFMGCSKLKQIVIPGTVKQMGTAVFKECKRMEEAVFERESEIKEIKTDTFNYCLSLKQVQLPPFLKEIHTRAFWRCKELKTVSFPRTLEIIGTEAFYQNGFLKLELPCRLKIIEDSAFFKCSGLEYVQIPESVKKIGKWVFHGCNRLKVLEIAHEPEYIGDWIINRSATIRCRKGSTVDLYCDKFGFSKEYL